MAQPTGRWKLGVTLTLFSIVLWGGQPLAIAMIKSIPFPTLAFYKIFSATVFVAGFLALRRGLPNLSSISLRTFALLGLAAFSLSVSYFCFNLCFKFISPSNVQVYFQLSRIFMALAGIFLFKESFSRNQWLGLLAVCTGLLLFFHGQLGQTANEGKYYLGVFIVVGSAATWALYAILQKALLPKLSALQILVLIYTLSTLFLVPYATAEPLSQMQTSEWLALIFICLSNVLAFACFSESLNHWESSKIATVSCLTPLVTITLMFFFANGLIHYVHPEDLGLMDLSGAALSIAGSIMVSLNR